MFNQHLTAFVMVADCGSFNKAAERLYISPPSVMKQINALEKHLGIRLFDRTNQGIRLTLAGQAIYRHAKYLFEYSRKAIEEARELEQTVEATFCIGSSLLNPCKPFMDLWYQVNDQFPGYKLHIVPFEDDHQGILAEIGALGEKYDFLVGACDSAKWLNMCSFYQIGTCSHCFAVSREHPLASKKSLGVRDLFGQTVMMVRRGDSGSVDTVRDQLERYPEIRIEDTQQFYDIEVFNRCAQTQNVMLTLDCWEGVHPALVTIPARWDYTIPYGLLYSKTPDDEVNRFISAVRRLAEPGE